MKEVFLRGFMCSTPEFNGQHAGVEYKESQMRAGSQLWERYFKESFNKCIRRLKRFGIRG